MAIKTIAVQHFSNYLNLFKPEHPVTEEYISEERHEIQIIKQVVLIYLKCRLHYSAKKLTKKLIGKQASPRQKMNKLILFQNV